MSAAPLWGELGMQARRGGGDSSALTSPHMHSDVSYSCVYSSQNIVSSQSMRVTLLDDFTRFCVVFLARLRIVALGTNNE